MPRTVATPGTQDGCKPDSALHLPDWLIGNPYQSLLAGGIEHVGVKMSFADYPGTEQPLMRLLQDRPDCRVIHLHWLAPYLDRLFWSRSHFRFLARLGCRIIDLIRCKRRGVRLVWTVHNLLSHESPYPERERLVRQWLARLADVIVFHSEGARQTFEREIMTLPPGRVRIIPHGPYLDVYPQDTEKTDQLIQRLGLTPYPRRLLFFGAIRAYKGIPQLLEAFSRVRDHNLALIIAGKVYDEALGDMLRCAAKADPRIRLFPETVPDDLVAPLHDLADAVVLPFENILTSGSVILAMSLGKALLLPEHARSLGAVPDTGAAYYGSGRSLAELMDALPSLPTAEMGRRNLSAMQSLSWIEIGRLTASCYTPTE